MRILLISRCPPYPLHLGDRLIVYHLARELELRKHDLDLLAFANRAEDWTEQGEYDWMFGHVELVEEPARSLMQYARRQFIPPTRFPTTANEAWSPAMWQAIQRRLDTNEYDAIHIFGGVVVYEYANALRGQPAVITPYESYSLYLRRAVAAASGLNRLALLPQWWIARAFERWMFQPYARTVVVSGRDRDELKALNPALPVEVIPNGVDLYELRPRPTERVDDVLLFTGNYEYAPNVDAALRLARDILPRVRARRPGVKLWLVGNAPPPELAALNDGDMIRVTGRVPDVRPYLARATAFISPLRLGAGIKNKVLEALAMGCPLVATPLSVDGIDVTDGEDALIAEGDALIDAIDRLLDDPSLRERLSLNGRRLVENRYSWTSVAARYEQLYAEVAHSS